MSVFSFGKSWFGVIFNPVGYMAQRKTPAQAASEYLAKNPTSTRITSADSEISFQEDRNSWIDKCANKLKGDDVGKTRANCLSACQGVFDADKNVINIKNGLVVKAQQEKEAVQQKLEITGKNILIYIGVFLFVGLIIYLLTSKK